MNELQRIYYAANPDSDKFWTSTFEEVLLVIQGQVDKWRIERRNAHRLHETFIGSEKALSVFDFNPLPYDDELREQDSTGLSDAELYNLLKESGYFNQPIN